jgi:hypothetical protein
MNSENLDDKMDDAIMESSDAHKSQMLQYLNNKELAAGFQRVVFDMLLAKNAAEACAGASDLQDWWRTFHQGNRD